MVFFVVGVGGKLCAWMFSAHAQSLGTGYQNHCLNQHYIFEHKLKDSGEMINADHDLKIYIVGKNQLHYELISFCLENELNAHCIFHPELSSVNVRDREIDRQQVLLVDCLDLDLAVLQDSFDMDNQPQLSQIHTALFNVTPECKLERFVKQHRIRGIFYKDDSRRVFIKGIRSILNGQLWLSRKLMSECILLPLEQGIPMSRNLKALSSREKVILKSVASGASNQEVADQLHISVHTVKTHLYKIYRKINVPNRLRAALWVNSCLPKLSMVNGSATSKDDCRKDFEIEAHSDNSFA